MPKLDELIKKRIEEIKKASERTEAQVRILQGLGFSAVFEWVAANIDTDSGRFKYTSQNLGRVSGLYRVLRDWQAKYSGTMLGAVLRYAEKLFFANEAYFESFDGNSESVADKARRLALQRWGYDMAKKALVPGGYLEGIFNNQAIAQRVASLVNQAILQKQPLADFQRTFRAVFVGRQGQGMLERHWRTNSFDMYQRLDRAANLVYADELGLDWAVYSGTLEEDSRPFCIARVNRVFSREQITSWKALEFQGKPKVGYDPFTDCGGYNCRHHLSWVSDGLAEKLKEKQASS